MSLSELGLKYQNNRTYDGSFLKRDSRGKVIIPPNAHKCEACPPFQAHVGGDKFDNQGNFTKFYERFMHPKRESNIDLLEIGIFRGESLAVWSDYFPHGHIYGMDGNLAPYHGFHSVLKNKGAWSNNNVQVFEGDATLPDSMNIIPRDVMFDFIIDDACHATYCIIKTFKIFFPRLKQGGVYFIEDNNIAGAIIKKEFPDLVYEPVGTDITTSFLLSVRHPGSQ